MSFKKLLSVLCSVALCFSCAACNVRSDAPDHDDKPNTDHTNGEIPDNNEVEILDPDDTEHDFTLISQGGGTFTYKCEECGKEETVAITYVSGTNNAYTVDGNTVTFGSVAANSVYDIRGSLHGNIVIDVSDDYKFELQMSGFELSSHAACPVSVLGGDKVTLSVKKSTENFIYDMRGPVDGADVNAIPASVYAQCDLNLQGKGSLNIKSVNNGGIHTKDDLNVKNLSLQIDCKDNALKGNDSVTVETGDLVLISRRGDGIKTTNSDVSTKGKQRGTVAITGGNILIYAACDGIAAAYDVKIDESASDVDLQIFTDKYSKFSEAFEARAFRPGGFGGFGPPEDGNTDKGDHSTKGIFADNCIDISAGKVTASAYDDAIHVANDGALENGDSPLGRVNISGGSLTLRSNDDAIHADDKVTVSGGTVFVVNSYEGIEGNSVEISGGNVSITSADDGINGAAASGTAIAISGGNVYVYAGGDGVDSNSKTQYEGIVFSGGRSVIISTTSQNSSIDTERGYKCTGGYVIGIGKSGGMGRESTNCLNFSSVGTSKTLNLQKDGYLVVEGIATVKMPTSFNALVVFLGNPSASVSSSASTSSALNANGVCWDV